VIWFHEMGCERKEEDQEDEDDGGEGGTETPHAHEGKRIGGGVTRSGDPSCT